MVSETYATGRIAPKREIRIVAWNERPNWSTQWSEINNRQRTRKLQNRHRSFIRTATNWIIRINDHLEAKQGRKDDFVLFKEELNENRELD